MFQFQYGAIGRANVKESKPIFKVSIPVWCDWESKKAFTRGGVPSFNPSMVRLGGKEMANQGDTIEVSIPVWCDWEII